MKDYQKSLDSLRDKSTRGLGSLIVSAGCDKDVDDYDRVLNNIQELVDKEKAKKTLLIDLIPILSPSSCYALIRSLNDTINYNMSVDDLRNSIYAGYPIRKIQFMEINRVNQIAIFLEINNEH